MVKRIIQPKLIGLGLLLFLVGFQPVLAQRGKKKTPTRQQSAAGKAKAKQAPAKAKKPTKPQPAPKKTTTQRPSSRRTSRAETEDTEVSLRQSRQQLEAEKRRNQERITEINRVLNQTASKKTATLTELKALNSKIETKSKQIDLLSQDLNLLNQEMRGLAVQSGKLARDLKNLKREYASMVYAASKTANTYNKLSFLFSANSFNSLVMRYQYLRQYTEARETQARHIEQVRGELATKQQTIKYKQVRKTDVLQAQVTETKTLEVTKERQAAVASELSKQETTLKGELSERTKAVNRLDNAIANVIEREIQRAAREREERLRRERIAREQAERQEAAAKARAEAIAKARADAAAKAAKAETPEKAKEIIKEAEEEVAKTPEIRPAEPTRASIGAAPEAEAGASFGSSRGRLPWPVRSGYISEHFGLNSPMPGITTRNLGVDIATNVGEPVRAVYEGIVRNVMSVPGMGTVITVQHGEYFTIYAKLASASVSEGHRVKAREVIGTALSDRNGGAEINFQIWKGRGKMNPEGWLAGK
ncbi:murein hydrolase activator EnvC family protein [Siphonobacter curvatus]|uniref:Peptidase M23 n=1 Tax=Siphonobacter curvatus TaxID=2094562 RepID=A0A2S7IJ19_9BACT|nr:M23 family metallopeptidase [Siphonobacter curvatus]PQA56272.1 peptidase M23 [Siphonobacter curvatus]